MEPTKTPTRDYPLLASNDWKLWDTIYGRRSNRKYLPMTLNEKTAGEIEKTTAFALEARGASAGSILTRTEIGQAEKIKRAAYKGAAGAINLWLLRTPISGFLVLAVPREDVSASRPKALPLTAMASEDLVLWLTEAGFGTCWMGGVNDREVGKALGMSGDLTIPAVIVIGKPKAKIEARDLDTLLYRRLSRRRKEIWTIASRETYGQSYKIGVVPTHRFRVSDVQDIEGLLRGGASDGSHAAEVPLELMIEACLEAARVAPSASNQQRWHFTVVSSESKLKEAASASGGSEGWRAAIIASGYPGNLYRMIEKPFWMLDLPIAFSHMSLMAASMGISYETCVNQCDEQILSKMINLPSELRVFGVLGLK
jgi:nitroreductase